MRDAPARARHERMKGRGQRLKLKGRHSDETRIRSHARDPARPVPDRTRVGPLPPVPADDARSRERGAPSAPDDDESDGQGASPEVPRSAPGDRRRGGGGAGHGGGRGQARRRAGALPRRHRRGGRRRRRMDPPGRERAHAPAGRAGPREARLDHAHPLVERDLRPARDPRRGPHQHLPRDLRRPARRASHAPRHPAAGGLGDAAGRRAEPRPRARPRCMRTREILSSRLDAEDPATLIAALFGDRAAGELGHPPLGLPPRAGLALALHGRLEPRRRRPSRDTNPNPSNRTPS